MRTYETIPQRLRDKIDRAFTAATKSLRDDGETLNMADPAERVIDALTEFVMESNRLAKAAKLRRAAARSAA